MGRLRAGRTLRPPRPFTGADRRRPLPTPCVVPAWTCWVDLESGDVGGPPRGDEPYSIPAEWGVPEGGAIVRHRRGRFGQDQVAAYSRVSDEHAREVAVQAYRDYWHEQDFCR